MFPEIEVKMVGGGVQDQNAGSLPKKTKHAQWLSNAGWLVGNRGNWETEGKETGVARNVNRTTPPCKVLLWASALYPLIAWQMYI